MDKLYARKAIKTFLEEDLGSGDITSDSIFSPNESGQARFIAKEAFVSAGMEQVAAEVFKTVNPAVTYEAATDGKRVAAGDVTFKVEGPVLDLLKAERVALNLVQRLCGIATLTAKFVEQTTHLPVKIVDTRKTTPGLRLFEKYAVRTGGGHNHRFSLSDGVLIKDNHIAAAGSIAFAVQKVRERAPHTIKIEVEAECIHQVEECLACGVDAILLDNMDCQTLQEAVSVVGGRVLLEASGGISIENVKEIAKTGVNIISIGALTHSAPSCDISMRMVN